MSVFVCATCERYVDSDFEISYMDKKYQLHCEPCVQDMSVQVFINHEFDGVNPEEFFEPEELYVNYSS